MIKRAHIYVSGRVQGVFFRAFVEKEANSLGLNGIVRNLLDGRVEIIAEGDVDTLWDLFYKSREGSELSLVEEVEIIFDEEMGEFNNFRIDF